MGGRTSRLCSLIARRLETPELGAKRDVWDRHHQRNPIPLVTPNVPSVRSLVTVAELESLPGTMFP